MNFTIRLMQLLNSSFPPSTQSITPDELSQISKCAQNNRVFFSFLEAVNNMKISERFAEVYENELKKYFATIDVISKISKVFMKEDIEHAIFKTVRPYRSTTVDIDIVIFGTTKEHRKAMKATREAGYKAIGYGPMSTTFQDPEIGIGIDLYKEIAVSYIIYMDKDRLVDYMTDINLPNGEQIRTLTPEADLAAIIAHSVIKEQMYTLSEYYTFIHYLEQMNIPNFIQIAKQTNITNAARTHANITALFYNLTHRNIPDKLQQILSHLREDKLETTSLIKNDFKTPHKYHPLTVGRALIEVAKGKKCRRSIAAQLRNMLNPKLTNGLLKDSIEHITRETY